MSHWKPYQATSTSPWDLKRVIHLHRRVAFGACWGEVQRDLNDDPQAAVTRVLNGTCRSEAVPEDFDQLSMTIGDSAVDSANADRLRAWWLYRCLFSPNPLEERLTLMWHNHFATSNLKVNDLRLMKLQNETLRRNSMAPFGELLRAVMHDPAMLEWLDAPSNRAGMPNENLARELMELFSLGIGNYSERDVSESARALTGWNVKQGQFHVVEERHDGESKTILNQSGNWTGDDLMRILLDQKACASRIAWRLTHEFFGENVVSDAAVSELADGLREHHLEVRWAVETMLRSESVFFVCEYWFTNCRSGFVPDHAATGFRVLAVTPQYTCPCRMAQPNGPASFLSTKRGWLERRSRMALDQDCHRSSQFRNGAFRWATHAAISQIGNAPWHRCGSGTARTDVMFGQTALRRSFGRNNSADHQRIRFTTGFW